MAQTKVATKPQLTAAVNALVDSAPGIRDTLGEIDAALSNDESVAAALATSVAGKAALSHTHAQTDITGLVAALAAKADDAATTTALASKAAAADVATAEADAQTGITLANQALNIVKPSSPGTFLVSGGSVAFAGTRSFTVAPAVYKIAGTQYTSPLTTVTIGASDPTNPRFDAIVVSAAVPGVVSVIAGTAAATPSFPDVDPLLFLVLTYVQIDAAASAVSVATTDIYRENTEWTSSVSGSTFNANSSSTPRTGSKLIQATAAANGDYVRLTAAAAVSLSGQRQLVFFLNPGAAFPGPKSIAVTFYLAGVKVGQSVNISNGSFGFDQTSATYQQIVIPIASFLVPATTLVDRLEFKVTGGGSTISFRIDDVFLEGASTAVPQPAITALQAQVEALRIRSILIPLDGGGVAVSTGVKVDVPLDFSGKILSWELLADQAGSIVIDLWRDSYANYPPTVTKTITAAAKPTLATAIKGTGNANTWASSFNAGDTLRVNVDSASTLLRATLSLKCQVAAA